MTSQSIKQTIAITYCPTSQAINIPSNQVIKFGQLIEYNMRNIFLEKSCTSCGGKAIPRPFSCKSKLSIFLDQKPEVSYSLFLLYAKLRAFEIYSNWSADRFLLPYIRFFLKKSTKWSGTSLPPLKIFILLYSINWSNFIVWLLLLCEILGNK